MAMRALLYRAALHISNFPTRTISTPKSFLLTTHASEDASHQTKSQNQHLNERELTSPVYEHILQLSEDEKPFDNKDAWKLTESTILREIRPITRFVKNILHSDRYKDGELLSLEDEEEIVQKLLPYHPCLEDKTGRSFDSIMIEAFISYREAIGEWQGLL